jgi:hypothetical protein
MSEAVKYSCAVCGGPMEVAGKCEQCALEEFEPKDFWAFMSLMGEMVHQATGRTEVYISKKQLAKFDMKDAPKLKWDPTTDNWIMVLAESPAVIIGVSKKILRSRN